MHLSTLSTLLYPALLLTLPLLVQGVAIDASSYSPLWIKGSSERWLTITSLSDVLESRSDVLERAILCASTSQCTFPKTCIIGKCQCKWTSEDFKYIRKSYSISLTSHFQDAKRLVQMSLNPLFPALGQAVWFNVPKRWDLVFSSVHS